MAIEGDAGASLRTLIFEFRPTKRRPPRRIKVRSTVYEGRLWLLVKDASDAIGWQPDTLSGHRSRQWDASVCLTENDWAYMQVKTGRGGHRLMSLVAADALSLLLGHTRLKQGQEFKRWLDTVTR